MVDLPERLGSGQHELDGEVYHSDGHLPGLLNCRRDGEVYRSDGHLPGLLNCRQGGPWNEKILWLELLLSVPGPE